MPKLLQSMNKHALSLMLLFAALLVFLIACDNPPAPNEIKPEISLSVDKTNLADGGGEVTLSAKVTRGKANSVTFKADTGLEIPPVTKVNAAGEFVTKVTVTATTNFTAQATGPAGTGTATQAKTVTVAPPNPQNDPEAPSSTAALKGFEGVDLVVGVPTSLAVTYTQIPGVTGGIVGEVQAETITTSKGSVTIKAGTNKLEFVYEPNAGATGDDSFEYTVVRTGRSEKGKVDISLDDMSNASFQVADSLADINDTNKSIVFLVNDVTCTASPCVRLENNQRLMGVGSLTIDGVTISNSSSAKPKIIANIPGTRRSGTGSCSRAEDLENENGGVFPSNEYDPRPNCAESRVIDLADNTTIEGIEITSTSVNDESRGYFTAIFGETDSNALNTLSGDIVIKNVTLTRSNGKPIYMKFGQGTNYGNYNLFIEGLELKDANDTMVIGNPSVFSFKNSTVELLQPAGTSAGSGPQPFGDSAGVLVETYINSTVTIDNVDVSMQNTRYRIDFLNTNNNAVPFEISSPGSGTTMNLTVKNSDITFGDILSGSDSAAFKVKGNGGSVVIDGSASINNTSKEGSSNAPGINRIGNVSGTIQFN